MTYLNEPAAVVSSLISKVQYVFSSDLRKNLVMSPSANALIIGKIAIDLQKRCGRYRRRRCHIVNRRICKMHQRSHIERQNHTCCKRDANHLDTHCAIQSPKNSESNNESNAQSTQVKRLLTIEIDLCLILSQ